MRWLLDYAIAGFTLFGLLAAVGLIEQQYQRWKDSRPKGEM